MALLPTGNPNEFSGSLATLTGADGPKTVQVTLGDAAGNTAFVNLQTVTYDTSILPGTLTVTPATAPVAALIAVQYVAAEALAVAPTLNVTLPGGASGNTLFGAPLVSGLVYTWTYSLVGADLPGTWSYLLSNVHDVAGNIATVPFATNVVDQTPPGVTASSVTPALVKANVPVTVLFTVSETQAPTYPRLSIGGSAVPLTATAVPQQYTGAVATLSGADGPKTVQVSLLDGAGNTAFINLASVTLDATLNAGALSVSPANAPAGATVTVQYVAAEALAATPTLAVTLPNSASGSALFGAPSVSGFAYTWTHTPRPR